MLDLKKSQTQIFSKRLAQIKHSQLIIEDLERLDNVSKLNLKTNYLLNSYFMNLVASWQTFIEELLKECVNDVSSRSDVTIKKILEFNLTEKIKKFSNPNTINIDNSFESLLGIKKITMELPEFEKSRKRLNEIMDIRHNIAHKGFSQKQLTMEENFNNMEFLLALAGQLEAVAIKHIKCE